MQKSAENLVEDVLDVDPAGYPAQRLSCAPHVFRPEFDGLRRAR